MKFLYSESARNSIDDALLACREGVKGVPFAEMSTIIQKMLRVELVVLRVDIITDGKCYTYYMCFNIITQNTCIFFSLGLLILR